MNNAPKWKESNWREIIASANLPLNLELLVQKNIVWRDNKFRTAIAHNHPDTVRNSPESHRFQLWVSAEAVLTPEAFEIIQKSDNPYLLITELMKKYREPYAGYEVLQKDGQKIKDNLIRIARWQASGSEVVIDPPWN